MILPILNLHFANNMLKSTNNNCNFAALKNKLAHHDRKSCTFTLIHLQSHNSLLKAITSRSLVHFSSVALHKSQKRVEHVEAP